MAKYDEKLARMAYLMEYDNRLDESKKKSYTGVEYQTIGADGKAYGILKEGTCYYIKTSTPENKMIAESYEYIGGFNNRSANRYHSYNEATKQLELKLMSLNESYGKHEDVSIADLNKTQKAMVTLTEAARADLDRMHQIFENSYIEKNIGNVSTDNVHGTANPSNTKELNDPFTETATASLDKDPKTNGTVKGATSDNSDVKNADSKLQNADKMEKGKRGDEGYKDTHDDLDGNGVADQHKSGAKSVKMNESIFEDDDIVGDAEYDYLEDAAADDAMIQGDELESLPMDDMGMEDNTLESEIGGDETPDFTDEFGDSEEYEDLDTLLEEFMNDEMGEQLDEDETQEAKQGNEETLKSYQSAGSGDNNVHGEKTMDKMDESEDVHVEGAGEKESKIVGPDKVMDGPRGAGNNNVHGEKTMDKMNESIERITNKIVESLIGKKDEKTCPKCGKKECTCKDGKCKCEKKKETLQEAIDRIVKEEIKLMEGQGWNLAKNAWKNREELPNTEQEYDEMFNGDEIGYENALGRDDKPYYDKYGEYTPQQYDKNGMRNSKVEYGAMGNLGRKAGVGVAKGLSKFNIAKNKWDIAHPKKNDGVFALQEAIDRIVKEEITRLDAWGKHPRYRKAPMTTPANKEVLAGTAEDDWNDESARGEQPYGSKIGSSAPFDKLVDVVTKQALATIKESARKGKK